MIFDPFELLKHAPGAVTVANGDKELLVVPKDELPGNNYYGRKPGERPEWLCGAGDAIGFLVGQPYCVYT